MLTYYWIWTFQDLPCVEVDEDTQIPCDEKCKQAKDKKLKAKQLEEKERKDSELRQQQEELEKFERKKHGRKRKQRQEVQDEQEETRGMLSKHKFLIGAILLIAIFVGFSVQLFLT